MTAPAGKKPFSITVLDLDGLAGFGEVLEAVAAYFIGCGYEIERWTGLADGFWIRCGNGSVLLREIDLTWELEGHTAQGVVIGPKYIDFTNSDAMVEAEGFVLDCFVGHRRTIGWIG